MRAEVISIGDELTTGQRLDTNSQWLSQRLGELGIGVMYHTTVADDLDANVAVFRTAIDRADVVIATGGLGPTADDLTRDAIAAAAGVELVEDAAALAHIEGLFARRKRAMPERNRLQAQFPRGSRVVNNPEGTAPGIDLDVPRLGRAPCRVFALPGVPAEMFTMWSQTVRPALLAMQPEPRVICHRRIKCFGVGESDLEAMLPDMIRRKREPLVGITVHAATITLRITASGPNEVACRELMEPTAAEIYQLLGGLVFGEEDDELEHAVVRLLGERHRSLAVAEWATEGLISKWLAEATSSDNHFRGGVIVRDATLLRALLNVSITNEAASSAETASAMALAVARATGATYGLGIAAFPASSDGALQVALATGNNVRVKAFPFASHPAIVKPLAAKRALNVVRLALLNRENI
ncbi:MAG: CinA family nicotinamide mononucleotide deamidase-related protein [Pirellulales bacterium]